MAFQPSPHLILGLCDCAAIGTVQMLWYSTLNYLCGVSLITRSQKPERRRRKSQGVWGWAFSHIRAAVVDLKTKGHHGDVRSSSPEGLRDPHVMGTKGTGPQAYNRTERNSTPNQKGMGSRFSFQRPQTGTLLGQHMDFDSVRSKQEPIESTWTCKELWLCAFILL